MSLDNYIFYQTRKADFICYSLITIHNKKIGRNIANPFIYKGFKTFCFS